MHVLVVCNIIFVTENCATEGQQRCTSSTDVWGAILL